MKIWWEKPNFKELRIKKLPVGYLFITKIFYSFQKLDFDINKILLKQKFYIFDKT